MIHSLTKACTPDSVHFAIHTQEGAMLVPGQRLLFLELSCLGIIGMEKNNGNKGKISTDMHPWSFRPHPHSNQSRDYQYNPRENPHYQGSSSSPSGQNLISNRVVMVSEHRRCHSWHLALGLAPITQALPSTKAPVASTPLWKRQTLLTSDSALPPKPVGTYRLQRLQKRLPQKDTPLKPR